jgi:CheY-like chemotaxis protein
VARRARDNPGTGPRAGRPGSGNLGLALLPEANRLGTIAGVGIRILIVDDDAGFLGLAAELLADRGFDVLGMATDATAALAATMRECPDGILLDINLPGRDGFATAAALSQACPSARIVLTSAAVRHVAADILRGCSADAFVPKEDLATADLDHLFRPAGT